MYQGDKCSLIKCVSCDTGSKHSQHTVTNVTDTPGGIISEHVDKHNSIYKYKRDTLLRISEAVKHREALKTIPIGVIQTVRQLRLEKKSVEAAEGVVFTLQQRRRRILGV